MKLEKRFRAQTWAISIVTAILTPLLAGLISWRVMAYQLSNYQHSLESRQKSEERQQKLLDEKTHLTRKLLDEKIHLTREASQSCGEMLSIRHKTQLDHFYGEFWSARAEIETKRGDKETAAKFSDMSNQSSQLENEDALRLATANGQFRSALLISKYYFDSKLQMAIQKFLSTEYPTTSISMTPNWSIEDVLSRNESRKKTENEYADQANAVVGTMAAEVAGDLKSNSE
jgi:hypothetical protein